MKTSFGIELEKAIDKETREAFDIAKNSLMYDYWYMGTERNIENNEYLMFKHMETKEYIKIPKSGGLR